jgi:hypothetical protein
LRAPLRHLRPDGGVPTRVQGSGLSAQGGDGSAGFVISGATENDFAGDDVYGPGDLNGDGIDDVVVRTTSNANRVYEAGKTYVIFGRTTGFPADFELATLTPVGGGDGSEGFVINGARQRDYDGDISSGDFNDDGLTDLLIGAGHSTPDSDREHAGTTYVLFGRTAGFPAEVDLSDLFPENGGDGSAGFVLDGVAENDRSGSAVGGTSDANGDGIDDILIGAHGTSQSFLIYGRTTPFPARIELVSLLPDSGGDGSVGFVLDGASRLDFSGAAVSGLSDVNGDGLTDLLIGAPRAIVPPRLNAGISCIVFGRAGER